VQPLNSFLVPKLTLCFRTAGTTTTRSP
jgi:hypothetical protein